jgi:hypothetical protein
MGAKRRRIWRRFVLPVTAALLLGLLVGSSCTPRAAEPRNPGEAAASLAFTCTAEGCGRAPAPANSPDTPIFEQDAIDLTGDGIPELVRREAAALVVHTQGPDGTYQEVWRSPEAWHVVDAALGDPNDDGRYEMMVAFWKDDDEGIARSHPFIVGYRNGAYQEVWGGSPVAEPIHELALADIDGDGVQDLIVLDASPDAGEAGSRTLSVWRWHGWGFSLLWRSEPGPYRNLVVVSEDDAAPVIVVTALPGAKPVLSGAQPVLAGGQH